jgi:carbon-monoxide dehydrogenase small subunit
MKMGDMKIPVALTVNGEEVVADVEPRTSLADFLREQLRLTAIHLGCEHGVCGACTVLINGTPARSCIALAVALEGADVRTLEGLAADPVMRTIKDAFHQEHGLQCGFCTPGILITAWDLLKVMPDPDAAAVRVAISGNLAAVPATRDRALDPASGRRCGPAGSARGPEPSTGSAAGEENAVPVAIPLRSRIDPAMSRRCRGSFAEPCVPVLRRPTRGLFWAYLRKHAFHKASNHISYSPRIFAPPRGQSIMAVSRPGKAKAPTAAKAGPLRSSIWRQGWPRIINSRNARGGDPRRPCEPDHQASQER